MGRHRNTPGPEGRSSEADVPAPEHGVEVPSPGRYHGAGDLGWLVQLIYEMQRDFGGLKKQVDTLDTSIASLKVSVDNMNKWSYLVRGGAIVLAVVASFAVWLFSERLESLRRIIMDLDSPQQQSEAVPHDTSVLRTIEPPLVAEPEQS
jgi:hypothetical protein